MSELLEWLLTAHLGWQLMIAGAILFGLLILHALFFAILRSSDEEGFDASRLLPAFCQGLLLPLGSRDDDGDADGGDGGGD